MFDSSVFVKKMWALKKWCVTKVAHCISYIVERTLVKFGTCILWSVLPPNMHYTIKVKIAVAKQPKNVKKQHAFTLESSVAMETLYKI